MTGPIIVTERLLLRPLAAEDFEPWAAFCADPETMRFLGGAQPRSVAWRGLCTMAGAWTIRGFSLFSLIERSSGRWVGRAGPWQPEGWPGTEIGWGVARAFTGRGYAYEAAAAAMDFAVDSLGWTDIIHVIDPGNTASIALAAKLGATHRGPVRLPPPLDGRPAEAWGQTAARWRTR